MTLEVSPSDAAENDTAAILDGCRVAIVPALQAAIEQLPTATGHMAGYALGLSELDGTPRDSISGKGLRPALTVLCAQAVGGPAGAAIPAAVAIELVHAFSLVHDDIIDGDERRRNRPALWKAYGVGPAVLSGDALLVLAMHTLTAATTTAPGAVHATAYLSETLIELVHGQADDMAFEDRPYSGPRAVTVKEYQAMAERKTGSLLGCAAAAGTLLGGGSANLAATMSRAGRRLGVAFQAVDDLIGITGDPAVTGKPVFGDLRQAKKTLPIIHALQSNTPSGRRLAELLTRRPTDIETLHHAAALIKAADGYGYTRRQAEHHLHMALTLITTADLTDPAAGQITTLARFLIDRIR